MFKKIDKVRPVDAWHEYDKKLLWEIKNFFFQKKNKKKLNSNFLEKVNCPACNSKKSKKYDTINFFKLVECNKCSLIYVNPRPTQEAQIDFFSKSKAMDIYSKLVQNTKSYRDKLIFKPLVNFLYDNFGNKKLRLLEIGCGAGLFLDALKKNNTKYRLYGLDINSEAVKICHKKKHNVICGSIENYNEEIKFDIIVFWAVLDHFADPYSVLKKCHKMLKKNGSIVIGNLNIEGFDSTILGKNNKDIYSVPERQNFFGINSMRFLLNRAGFKKIYTTTTGKLDVDLVKKYWDNNPKISKDKFLNKLINSNDELRENFQNFLIQNNLSSHMTTIAKK